MPHVLRDGYQIRDFSVVVKKVLQAFRPDSVFYCKILCRFEQQQLFCGSHTAGSDASPKCGCSQRAPT